MYKQRTVVVIAALLGLGMLLPLGSQAACNSAVTATAPDSRYTNNGNGTVTDKQNGLMWAQCSEGQSSVSTACDTNSASDTTYTWQQALQRTETLNNSGGFAGFTDWRLPNRNELASLVERQCYSQSINSNLFPNTLYLPGYWTSSPNASDVNSAWAVDFVNGFVGVDLKSKVYFVRLVRGGL